MNIKSLKSILVLIICGLNAYAQNTINDLKDDSIITLDNKVRYGKLDNGFTYYLRDNDSETTEFKLVVRAGMFNQEKNQLDYAHLMEHMVFKYPLHFPPEENYFRSGGRYIHARTEYTNTFYYARIPSEDKEGIRNGFKLLRDWTTLTNMNQAAIDVERGAVIGEGRVRDMQATWMNDTIENLLLKNINLEFPTRLELKSSMMNFNREAFITFHDDWYRPDLQAAIIVGNINVDSAEVNIKRLFSDLKKPANPKSNREKLENKKVDLPGENQFITVYDSLKPGLRMYIVSKNMNREYLMRSEKDYKEMLKQQLYETLIGERGKIYIRDYNPPFNNFTPDYAATSVAAGQVFASMMTIDFPNENRKDILKRFRSALEAWKKMHTGLNDAELKEAKNQIKANYSLAKLKSSESLSERYSDHFVLGRAAMNPQEELNMIVKLLDEISLSEIQNFTSDFGDLSKNTDFLIFTGKPELVPSKTSLKNMVEEVKQLKVNPPSPTAVSIRSLKDLVPLPEKIETANVKTSESLVGITTITLQNGIKIMLKPTRPRQAFFKNRVSIRAFRPHRVPLSDKENYLIASVVPDVIQFLGIGPYTKFDLEKFKQEYELEFGWKMIKDFNVMEGFSNMENIEELINLMYLYIANPRQNAKDFSYWKDFKKYQLKNIPKASGDFYMDEIHAIWYPELPRLEREDIDEMNFKEIFESHKKWYSDFHDFTFIVTGDFDRDVMISVLSKKLSVFPVEKVSDIDKTTKYKFPLRRMDTIIRMSQINQAFVTLYFPIKVSKDVKTRAELNLISKALRNRIWERLREGSYGPTAKGDWLDHEQGIYAFSVSFDSELDNYEYMIKAALEELNILKEKGVKEDWLEREIIDEQASFSNRIESFGYFNFWPDFIQKMERTEESPEEIILKYESVLEHFVSLEDINQAAKTYLNTDHLQKFIVLPEGFEVNPNLNN